MEEPLDYHETAEDIIPDKDDRMWATFAHLGIVAGLVVPLGNILLPLVLWLVYKDRSDYVSYHAKEALNFQLTVSIAIIGAIILIFVFIGIPLIIGLAIFDLVFSIIAAVRANDGERYRYPYTLRLVN